MELYQAEWCPHSHRVRQRLTELGLDFYALQVPSEPERRIGMLRDFDTSEIPLLVDRDETLRGDEEILEYLDRVYREPPDAERHREKAREEVREFDEVAG
jgi:glutathione S-transferase